MIKLKNNTANPIILKGFELPAGDYYQIPRNEVALFQSDSNIETMIFASDLVVATASEDIADGATGFNYLMQDFPYSCAVDKNNIDQNISGTDWTELTAAQALWDYSSNYNLVDNDFEVSFSAVYFADGQLKLNTLSNVTKIEVAIFKRGTPDDYWFILDEKTITAGVTEAQMSWGTLFDMYAGEDFCVKVKLYGSSPSATIVGSDDFSAWGYNYQRMLG